MRNYIITVVVVYNKKKKKMKSFFHLKLFHIFLCLY